MRPIASTLLMIVLVMNVASCADDSPALQSTDFATAREQAEREEKLLVVFATAEWCIPCQRMKDEVWVDGDVESWIADHAIVFEFDVDQEQQLAEKLGITGLPSLVVFKDGEEYDRASGYQTADELLGWLNAVRKGMFYVDYLHEKIEQARRTGQPVDEYDRMVHARELLRHGRYEEATEAYEWMWRNVHEMPLHGFAAQVIDWPREITYLIEQHKPAHDVFAAIRDELTPRVESGGGEPYVFHEWLNLNRMLGDDALVLDWFDRFQDASSHAEMLSSNADRLASFMRDHRRWEDAGSLLDDPAVQLSLRFDPKYMSDFDELYPDMTETERRQMREEADMQIATYAIESSAWKYAALLAADRFSDAKTLADTLFQHVDTGEARKALVEKAVEIGVAKEQHQAWLDQAADKGTDVSELARKLRNQLASP